ncbi:MAG: hypothetical protein IPN79_14395 [Saprospiraceae bacterium]|nr:hypothetical protein [Saprospiraceae bacterium]
MEYQEIFDDLQLAKVGQSSNDDLLNHIEERVQHFLTYDRGLLLSYMYRLDIEEKIIEKALMNQNEEPISLTLAKLILERQIKRLETKKKYGSPPPIEGWEY